MLGRSWVVLVVVCLGCGIGVPPPCDQLSADRQFVCAKRSSKSYCVVCYDSQCGTGKQQCFVRTSDESIFSCDACGGNRGCFENDNAAVNAWCSTNVPATEVLPSPVCGQQGGTTCMCAKRAIDLARAPPESRANSDLKVSDLPTRYAEGNVLRPASSCSPQFGQKCCFDSRQRICACQSVAGLTDCSATATIDDCSKASW